MNGQPAYDAALARARRAELPAPWPDVLESLDGIVNANDSLMRLVEMIQTRHDDELTALRDAQDELRADRDALSHRIESLTRLVNARTSDAA